MAHRDQWIVIGISGVTCGGKTSLANRLMQTLQPAQVFHQDRYFYPDDSPHHVRCANLEHNNYDILSALDMASMARDVTAALNVPPAHSDVTPLGGRLCAPGKGFLVVEGFTVLNYEPLLELCDLRYYFVLEYGECLSRRTLREYDPPDIPGYFEQCVWPEHLKYRAQIEKDPRVKLIDGRRGDAFELVVADLKRLGVSEVPPQAQ